MIGGRGRPRKKALMPGRRPLGAALLLGCALVGCVSNSPCAAPGEPAGEAAATIAGEVYLGSGDSYALGALETRIIDVERCEFGAPTVLRIYAPTAPANYAVVVFQHGFLSRNDFYDDILSRLASHGFVVVAPQMYEPGIGVLLGSPSAAEEAVLAGDVIDWLPAHLGEVTGLGLRTDRIGIAGHSRGGKVAWLAALATPARVAAIAGIDPVDGTGGPLGNQDRVVTGEFALDAPALVLGTELGGSCAPEGDNHEQFFSASRAPAWHVIALGQGHGDMLDEDAAAAAGRLCARGGDGAGMRQLTAGLMVALFRGVLQGDSSSLDALGSTRDEPSPTVRARK